MNNKVLCGICLLLGWTAGAFAFGNMQKWSVIIGYSILAFGSILSIFAKEVNDDG